jgi:predicted nucleic acid-binding protein
VNGVYLDSSAVTKLVVLEAESGALRAVIRGRPCFTSRIAVVEVSRAVRRRAPGVDAAPVLRHLSFVELDAELARSAASLLPEGLRSLDAIHIASALLLGSAIEAFITFDDRQREAATTAGLTASPT